MKYAGIHVAISLSLNFQGGHVPALLDRSPMCTGRRLEAQCRMINFEFWQAEEQA